MSLFYRIQPHLECEMTKRNRDTVGEYVDGDEDGNGDGGDGT